jgi:2-polyprenyl-6-methoxyphenol hydroxylase-like FAD-dependent oxidoreductase
VGPVTSAQPRRTQVLIAGGGPVGLAAAIELGRRGIGCVVVEPRTTVSRARPRCKTINVRTMEHLRRWGIADRLRERAPLPVAYSQDIVFCTSLTGYVLSRFTGVLGLSPEGERFPEVGQQAPQYVFEELLRAAASELSDISLLTGRQVIGLDQDEHEVRAQIAGEDGTRTELTADYALGCDGPRSTVREAIGSHYIGEHSLRPNFGMVFHAPELLTRTAHGSAVQYWILNDAAPSLLGPIDLHGTWWMIAFGIDREQGSRDASALIDAAAGEPTEARVLSVDPWRARMQLVDHARRRRVFLAGDAAHLNPPFGGHGLNTGIGDAVDLGWKLAAVLHGWGGSALLESYEAERRPVQTAVIGAAEANNRVLATELLSENLDTDDATGQRARHEAHHVIQASKQAEFHALDLVLDIAYENSPVVPHDATPNPPHHEASPPSRAVPGARLPHARFADARSIYDELGSGMTLLALGPDTSDDAQAIETAARARRVPMRIAHLQGHNLHDRYGARLIMVRPDQHVAWSGHKAPRDTSELIDLIRGAGGQVEQRQPSS